MSEIIIAMRGTVYENGYGLIAKKVMQDKSISIKAKALYAYLSSFAGSGGEERSAFPSIGKILDDLCISKDSFYKYRKELERAGYITVKQDKDNDGTFKNNIYYIEAVPCPKISDTEPFPKKPDTALPDTVNSDTNNNSFKSNKFNIKEREREELAEAPFLLADRSDESLERNYELLKEITRRVFGMPRAEQVDVESIWNHWHNRFPQYDLTHLYAVMRATQQTARIRDDLTGIIVKRLPNAKAALVPVKQHAIDYIASLRRELKHA